jgi:hypothetical protein
MMTIACITIINRRLAATEINRTIETAFCWSKYIRADLIILNYA